MVLAAHPLSGSDMAAVVARGREKDGPAEGSEQSRAESVSSEGRAYFSVRQGASLVGGVVLSQLRVAARSRWH